MKRVGVFLAAAALALTACAGEGQAPQLSDNAERSENIVVDVPEFSGPYKDELTKFYLESESDFFRQVISDQWVSDEELREGQERSKQCLEDVGFTDVEYFPEGGSSHAERTDISEQKMYELFDECEMKTGYAGIEVWYGALRRNPDNVDWPSAERDCLVRAGLLPEGTSVADMYSWYESGDPAASSAVAYQCSQDALGHLSTGSE